MRSPEQLKAYNAAKHGFEQTHGGTANFVIAERLKWTGTKLKSSGKPFLTCEQDIKILENDFSYYFEPGIRHFVVWSKVPIPCDSTEYPTPEAAAKINSFIKREFVERCSVPPENTMWFKNTGRLQSVPSVSHFHVLVRDCTNELAKKIINT